MVINYQDDYIMVAFDGVSDLDFAAISQYSGKYGIRFLGVLINHPITGDFQMRLTGADGYVVVPSVTVKSKEGAFIPLTGGKIKYYIVGSEVTDGLTATFLIDNRKVQLT